MLEVYLEVYIWVQALSSQWEPDSIAYGQQSVKEHEVSVSFIRIIVVLLDAVRESSLDPLVDIVSEYF